MPGTILSLFDRSGNWPAPFKKHGFNVIQVDKELGQDILTYPYQKLTNVVGILAAPPCTAFSKAGATFWLQKDEDGRTDEAIQMVRKTLEIVSFFKGSGNLKFWAIENPPGRIERCVPELKPFKLLGFQPYQYGDAYTKFTWLWGEFNPFLVRKPVKPVKAQKTASGNYYSRMSIEVYYDVYQPKIRSITPPGFAQAFCEAQLLLL